MRAVGSAIRLLSTEEVAELLHVSQRTVQNWTKQDKIPYLKLPGGELRIPLQGLLASISGTYDLATAMAKVDEMQISDEDVAEALVP